MRMWRGLWILLRHKNPVPFPPPQKDSDVEGCAHFLFPHKQWWKLCHVERFSLSENEGHKHGIKPNRLIQFSFPHCGFPPLKLNYETEQIGLSCNVSDLCPRDVRFESRPEHLLRFEVITSVIVKIAVTACGSETAASILLGLLLDPEDGCDMFLRNIGLVQNFTGLQPTRPYPLCQLRYFVVFLSPSKQLLIKVDHGRFKSFKNHHLQSSSNSTL
jgi:hypothetical protein